MNYNTPTDRLLQILVALGQSPEAMSAKALSQDLQQPLSSTYRHLKTLLRWGLAEDNGQGRYVPGPTCLQLAKKFDREGLLVTLAKPELKRLAELSQESVALMVPSNGQAICIELVDSPQPLRCCYQKGLAQPLLLGASARVLLAYMEPERSLPILQQQGIEQAEYPRYLEGFAAIRQAGHAVSLSEIDEGIWGVSAPLLDSRERLQGAISLMAPAFRAEQNRERLIRWTREAAQRLSARLD
ncbi:IclR family transcriptional regulator [Pseudomonas sp. PH1b]|uniref:IclR family transcriptional regulator n=1 Tax=Pseudomonas sp. PH1b TaxID=1397282 RepID=UPI000468C75A|nr:IclR family transcriptional regulator [Pseudomonas sp. PH1b]BFD39097.1 IclR family transcriptional regulator [Pseudomonas sp. FFPRI_1]